MASDASKQVIEDRNVNYFLRDTSSTLVAEWTKHFTDHQDHIKVSKGDIFNGAPAVDAVVTPSNGFGNMDGGVDGRCRKYFGQQIQTRLQEHIQNKNNGEILVGQAVIIPAYEKESGQKTIKYLIVSPTMRVVTNISATVNAYLSFKAVLLAVHKHNSTPENDPIKAVLVPGLGTGHGSMPPDRCAYQMLQAYETFVKRLHPSRVIPEIHQIAAADHKKMIEYGGK